MQKVNNTIAIEGGRLIFRNFAGKADNFNTQGGNRTFCVCIENDLAEKLIEDGWNVRWLNPRDEDEDRQAYLQVKVSFNNVPPKIILMSSKGESKLDEEGLDCLDWAEIETVDLILSPYNWTLNGKSGVKAYLKSMYVLLREDEFEQKWANRPKSAADAIGGCGNCDTCDGSCNHDGDQPL